jgi:hypothetical protein
MAASVLGCRSGTVGCIVVEPRCATARQHTVGLAAAYHQWEHTGRPPVTQWRFTITPEGQHVERYHHTNHDQLRIR